jgi:hypothetical protein
MPRNTTGGSGHKAQRNSESSKARNNRTVVDDLLDDYRDKSNTDGVFVGRVLRRMGCGRMEVFYSYKKFNEFEGEHAEDRTQIMPMCGALRGKGKKNVWIEPGSLVIVAETGLSGTTHEIRAVFSDAHVARLRKVKPDLDERLFVKMEEGETKDEGGVVFEKDDEDVDIDDI